MKYAVYLLILFTMSISAAGQNLIRNGSLETGTFVACPIPSPPNSEILGPDWWYLAFPKPNSCNSVFDKDCPSADWFTSECIGSASYLLPPNAGSGNRCIGMGRYLPAGEEKEREGVRVELSDALKPGHLYELSLRMALSVDSLQSAPLYYYRDYPNKLEISFTTWGTHWNSSSAGNMKWTNTTNQFTIPASSAPGWYTYTWKFKCPEEIGSEDVTNKLLNMLIRQDIGNQLYSYIYIDDVQLLHVGDPCRSVCTPAAALDAVTFPYGIVDNNAEFGGVSDYKLPIKNATKVEIMFFDGWGGKFYDQTYEDPNVLYTPYHPYFVVEWGCTMQDGSPVMEDTYSMRIRYKNCATAWTERAGTVTYIYNSTGSNVIHIPDYLTIDVDTLATCCIDNLYRNNMTYTNDVIEAVNYKLWSGLTGPSQPVIVDNGARVYYSAGEEIKLGSGFRVLPGGQFTAKIQPCQAAPRLLTGKSNNSFVFNQTEPLTEEQKARLEKEKEKRVQRGPGIKVWPNPFLDVVSMEVSDAYYGQHYSVLDMAGKRVRTGVIQEGASIIDLSDLSSGTYLLKIEGTSEHFKLIKLH